MGLDRGSVKQNAAPPPTRFSAEVFLRSFSTIVRAMDNPNPVPCDLVVKNGSKIFSRLSLGIPLPESKTVSSAEEFSACRSLNDQLSHLRRLVRQGIHSVHDEIQYHLMHLNPICPDRQRRWE